MATPQRVGIRVLIVDDDRTFRALVRTVLVPLGYDVVEVSNAAEALASARARRPSVVLLDVALPDVSGYEACRELRDEFGEQLPIAFVSGKRAEWYDRTAGLLLGADDYLVKPFSNDELLARVRRLAARGVETPSAPLDDLTTRELDVLRRLASGRRQEEIASELFISSNTVATHIQRILAKLGVHSRAEAVAVAYRYRLGGIG